MCDANPSTDAPPNCVVRHAPGGVYSGTYATRIVGKYIANATTNCPSSSQVFTYWYDDCERSPDRVPGQATDTPLAAGTPTYQVNAVGYRVRCASRRTTPCRARRSSTGSGWRTSNTTPSRARAHDRALPCTGCTASRVRRRGGRRPHHRAVRHVRVTDHRGQHDGLCDRIMPPRAGTRIGTPRSRRLRRDGRQHRTASARTTSTTSTDSTGPAAVRARPGVGHAPGRQPGLHELGARPRFLTAATFRYSVERRACSQGAIIVWRPGSPGTQRGPSRPRSAPLVHRLPVLHDYETTIGGRPGGPFNANNSSGPRTTVRSTGTRAAAGRTSLTTTTTASDINFSSGT